MPVVIADRKRIETCVTSHNRYLDSYHIPRQSTTPPLTPLVYALPITSALLSWNSLCRCTLFFNPSSRSELRSLRARADSAPIAASGSGTSLILNNICTLGIVPLGKLSLKITISVTCLVPSSALCWKSKKASVRPNGEPKRVSVITTPSSWMSFANGSCLSSRTICAQGTLQTLKTTHQVTPGLPHRTYWLQHRASTAPH